MQNFGQGMWRRISNYQKYQPVSLGQTNSLGQMQSSSTNTNKIASFLQMQKQRALDAYRAKTVSEPILASVSASVSEPILASVSEEVVSDSKDQLTIDTEYIIVDHIQLETEEIVIKAEPVIQEDNIQEALIQEEDIIQEEVAASVEVKVVGEISKKKRKKNR